MESSGTLGRFSRHRKVLALSLAVAVLPIAYVLFGIAPKYKASGTLLLTPPGLSATQAQILGNPAGQNPVLSFSSSLTIVATITARAMTADPNVRDLVTQKGATTFSLATTSDSPTITASATSRTRSSATEAATALVNAVQQNLASRQKSLNAPADSFIAASVIVAPRLASAVSNTRNKLLLVSVMLDLAIIFGAAWVADALTGRRVASEAQAPVHVTEAPFNGHEAPPLFVTTKTAPREYEIPLPNAQIRRRMPPVPESRPEGLDDAIEDPNVPGIRITSNSIGRYERSGPHRRAIPR
jgi:hypothetical protein